MSELRLILEGQLLLATDKKDHPEKLWILFVDPPCAVEDADLQEELGSRRLPRHEPALNFGQGPDTVVQGMDLVLSVAGEGVSGLQFQQQGDEAFSWVPSLHEVVQKIDPPSGQSVNDEARKISPDLLGHSYTGSRIHARLLIENGTVGTDSFHEVPERGILTYKFNNLARYSPRQFADTVFVDIPNVSSMTFRSRSLSDGGSSWSDLGPKEQTDRQIVRVKNRPVGFNSEVAWKGRHLRDHFIAFYALLSNPKNLGDYPEPIQVSNIDGTGGGACSPVTEGGGG